MKYMNLLAAKGDRPDLIVFAREFFSALGVTDYEERESSFYPEERYFEGSDREVKFIVALSDETDHDDLPIWIHVTTELSGSTDLVSATDLLIQEKLSSQGFRFARLINFGMQDEQRIDY